MRSCSMRFSSSPISKRISARLATSAFAVTVRASRSCRLLPVPIAGPRGALGVGQRSGDDPFPLRAVGDPAVVFAPGYLAGISLKVLSANAVVDTELATVESGEITFGL